MPILIGLIGISRFVIGFMLNFNLIDSLPCLFFHITNSVLDILVHISLWRRQMLWLTDSSLLRCKCILSSIFLGLNFVMNCSTIVHPFVIELSSPYRPEPEYIQERRMVKHGIKRLLSDLSSGLVFINLMQLGNCWLLHCRVGFLLSPLWERVLFHRGD